MVPGLSERGDHLVDLDIEGRDGALEVLEVAQGESHQQSVMVIEAAVQRLA